jgi:hypothetical protein
MPISLPLDGGGIKGEGEMISIISNYLRKLPLTPSPSPARGEGSKISV